MIDQIISQNTHTDEQIIERDLESLGEHIFHRSF